MAEKRNVLLIDGPSDGRKIQLTIPRHQLTVLEPESMLPPSVRNDSEVRVTASTFTYNLYDLPGGMTVGYPAAWDADDRVSPTEKIATRLWCGYVGELR